MNQVVLYDVSDNIAELVKTGKYGAINTTDTTKRFYYLIKFIQKPTH